MLTKKKELFIYIFFSSLLSLGAIFNKGVINTACKILFVRSKIDQAIEKIPKFSNPRILKTRIVLIKFEKLTTN